MGFCIFRAAWLACSACLHVRGHSVPRAMAALRATSGRRAAPRSALPAPSPTSGRRCARRRRPRAQEREAEAVEEASAAEAFAAAALTAAELPHARRPAWDEWCAGEHAGACAALAALALGDGHEARAAGAQALADACLKAAAWPTRGARGAEELLEVRVRAPCNPRRERRAPAPSRAHRRRKRAPPHETRRAGRGAVPWQPATLQGLGLSTMALQIGRHAMIYSPNQTETHASS